MNNSDFSYYSTTIYTRREKKGEGRESGEGQSEIDQDAGGNITVHLDDIKGMYGTMLYNLIKFHLPMTSLGYQGAVANDKTWWYLF